MVLNADKCQSVMCLGKDTENPKFFYGNIYVDSKEKNIRYYYR